MGREAPRARGSRPAPNWPIVTNAIFEPVLAQSGATPPREFASVGYRIAESGTSFGTRNFPFPIAVPGCGAGGASAPLGDRP